MRQQLAAAVVCLGEFFFTEYGMNMAMAGSTDVQNASETVVSTKALANAFEPMGATWNKMMAGRTYARPSAELAAAIRRQGMLCRHVF